jgi:outer membrane protein assembly factor BamB
VTRLCLLLVGAALLAGCEGSQQHTAVETTVAKPRAPKPAPVAPVVRRPRVQVTVVDGDTNRRVRGARVRIGTHAAKSDAHGVAHVPLVHRGAYVTVAAKRGYVTRSVRLAFRQQPKSTIRIYKRSLQWTTYKSDPGLKVRPPFKVVWSRGLGNLIEFPAVVANGVAFIANARGSVRALDMRTGALVWRHDIPHGKMASSPAVVGDTVLVHGMDGHVWALSRYDGHLLWHHTVGSPIESSPVVAGDLDLFGAWNGTVTALDLRTHRVRWRRSLGCKITSSAALAGSTFFIGDYCGRLLRIGVASGRVLWTRSVNGRIYGTPAVSGGRVFVPSSTGGSLTAFSTGGRYLWRRSTGSYVYSSPAAAGGRVFFGSYNGVFYGLSVRTGATLWAHGTGGPISGAAVYVDGVAYAGSFAHRIFGVDARTGRVVLNFPHGEYVPVSGGGNRLLLHGFSRLYAVKHD